MIVEKYDIRGMGHGTPIDTRDSEACGTTGPHMLEANICSTRHIANSWGLVAEGVSREDRAAAGADAVTTPSAAPAFSPNSSTVGAVIEDALRAAGLMH